MAIPRVRMPSISFDSLSGVLPTRRILLYTAYTVLLFLVFLIAQFPHDVIVQRALRSVDLTPFRLDVAETRFAWFRGYQFNDVEITRVDADEGTPPILESSRLYVRPGLDGLIRGRLGSVYMQAAMYSGNAEGSWAMDNGIHRATLRLEDLQIGRYRWLLNSFEEGEIDGLLSGVVSVESRRGNTRDGQIAGELDIKKAFANGIKVRGFAVPELSFSTISAKFAVKGDQVDIEDLRADGPQLKLSGAGTVNVRTPPADSVLNLKVTLQPGANSDESIRGLLALVPRPKNARPDAPMTITGTLAQPRVR